MGDLALVSLESSLKGKVPFFHLSQEWTAGLFKRTVIRKPSVSFHNWKEGILKKPRQHKLSGSKIQHDTFVASNIHTVRKGEWAAILEGPCSAPGEFTPNFRTYFCGDWDVHWGYGIGFDPLNRGGGPLAHSEAFAVTWRPHPPFLFAVRPVQCLR